MHISYKYITLYIIYIYNIYRVQIFCNVILMAVLKTDVFKTKDGTYPMCVLVPPEPTLDSAPGPDFCGSEWEEMGCWSLAPIPMPLPNSLVFHRHQPTWPRCTPQVGEPWGLGMVPLWARKPCGVSKSAFNHHL